MWTDRQLISRLRGEAHLLRWQDPLQAAEGQSKGVVGACPGEEGLRACSVLRALSSFGATVGTGRWEYRWEGDRGAVLAPGGLSQRHAAICVVCTVLEHGVGAVDGLLEEISSYWGQSCGPAR